MLNFAYIIVKIKKNLHFYSLSWQIPIAIINNKRKQMKKKQKKGNQWINPWLERRNQQEQLLRAVP